VTSAVTVVAITVAILAALIITVWMARSPGEVAAGTAEEGSR